MACPTPSAVSACMLKASRLGPRSAAHPTGRWRVLSESSLGRLACRYSCCALRAARWLSCRAALRRRSVGSSHFRGSAGFAKSNFRYFWYRTRKRGGFGWWVVYEAILKLILAFKWPWKRVGKLMLVGNLLFQTSVSVGRVGDPLPSNSASER